MGALHDLSALEQGALVASGECTAVELTEHYLERSERWGPVVGAFVTLTPELALEQALAVDTAVRGGAHMGPLAGVVCPVKDLDAVAGVPMRLGSVALQQTPEQDANVVNAMRAAGLIFTGKTTTPEFGLPCYTEPDGLPPARSPWSLELTASGSSGGAAAAVAAGLAPIAQGSDGGGSVRLPASACGLVGIKPSRGRVSNGPLADSVGDLLCYGPLARTVADAAALLDVMAAPFVGDPYRALPAGPFLDAARRAPGQLRIGWYTEPIVGRTPPTADVEEAVEVTVGLLAELGHQVEQIAAPLPHEAVAVFEVLWAALADSVVLPEHVESQLTPLTRYLRGRARTATSGQLATAIAETRRLARVAMNRTAEYDVVLSPTAAAAPFAVGTIRDDSDPAADFEAQKQWASYTSVYNLSGQPSINVPLFWRSDGVPIGVQFAARRDEEGTMISLAAQLEAARPWSQRRPEMW